MTTLPPQPIDAIKDLFLLALDSRTPIIVTADTGAGKSTRIPLWLSEWTKSQHLTGVVLVVEPRRVACQSLASFLSLLEKQPLGLRIGSRVRFADDTSDSTELIFATPGIALNILANPDSQKIAAVVLDEFHERGVEVDLLLTLLSSKPRYHELPIVITSATLDVEPIATKLSAKTIHASGRSFPVSILYAEDFLPRGENVASQPSLYGLDENIVNSVTYALNNLEGNILVFLPGFAQINSALGALNAKLKSQNRTLSIEVVHGSRPPEILNKILSEHSDSNHTVIYLSTNIAETSITIPNVNIVIDSGLAKTHLHQGGQSALATIPIAQDSMDQRSGRAGRLRPGTTLRLWSERFRPELFTRPEISRIELDDLILQAAACNLDGSDFDNATWITQPPEFAVENARSRLRKLGALDALNRITTFGRDTAQLPVSAKDAALLCSAKTSIQPFFCDLIALLQIRGNLLHTMNNVTDVVQVKDARFSLLQGIGSPIDEAIRILHRANKTHAPTQRLYDARRISNQLRALLHLSPIEEGELLSGEDGVVEHILEVLPSHGFVRRNREKSGRAYSAWTNGVIEVQMRDYEGIDPMNPVTAAKGAVIFDIRWQTKGTRIYAVSDFFIATTYDKLAAAELGEVEVAGVELERKSPPYITGQIHRHLSGVEIESVTRPLRGRELCRATAELIKENRIFSNSYDALLDALHLWILLSEWSETEFAEDLAGYQIAPPPPYSEEPVKLLAERLYELGVRNNEDLELIEREDLIPKPGRGFGTQVLPDWIVHPLSEEFPRTWSYQSASYLLQIEASRKRVTFKPLNKLAKKNGEPERRYLPNFRGFECFYEHASRRVKIR